MESTKGYTLSIPEFDWPGSVMKKVIPNQIAAGKSALHNIWLSEKTAADQQILEMLIG